MKTSYTVTKGQGLRVNDNAEVFQVGKKDWAVVDFQTQSAHYFLNKREAMRFIKQCGSKDIVRS